MNQQFAFYINFPGPGEYCNGRSRCECVKNHEAQCLEPNSCQSDGDCESGMGSRRVCDTGHGYCVCEEGFRLMPNGKCAIDTRGM